MTWLGLFMIAAALIGATTQRIIRHVDRLYTVDGERRNAGGVEPWHSR